MVTPQHISRTVAEMGAHGLNFVPGWWAGKHGLHPVELENVSERPALVALLEWTEDNDWTVVAGAQLERLYVATGACAPEFLRPETVLEIFNPQKTAYARPRMTIRQALAGAWS